MIGLDAVLLVKEQRFLTCFVRSWCKAAHLSINRGVIVSNGTQVVIPDTVVNDMS